MGSPKTEDRVGTLLLNTSLISLTATVQDSGTEAVKEISIGSFLKTNVELFALALKDWVRRLSKLKSL